MAFLLSLTLIQDLGFLFAGVIVQFFGILAIASFISTKNAEKEVNNQINQLIILRDSLKSINKVEKKERLNEVKRISLEYRNTIKYNYKVDYLFGFFKIYLPIASRKYLNLIKNI